MAKKKEKPMKYLYDIEVEFERGQSRYKEVFLVESLSKNPEKALIGEIQKHLRGSKGNVSFKHTVITKKFVGYAW